MIVPPINFQKWIEENRSLLRPPVGNTCLLRTDGYFIMAVGGPNERSDFHYQPTEELFYQAKGYMHLRIVDEGKFRTIEIKEGEYFLLPANTLHSPKRFADTIGLVLERTRERDQVHWFCPNLKAHDDKPFMVYCDEFLTKDLFEDLPKLLKRWASSEELRICRGCGYQAAPLESPECPLV